MSIKKAWNNQEIAQLLDKVAIALTIKKENRFRIVAYENAAQAIKNIEKEIKELWEKGKLNQIPGVGANIASYLDELFKTGKVKHFDKIFKNLPETIFELIKIPGIGPKLALKLSRELKLKDKKLALTELKKAAKKGKIKTLEGFGEKSEQEILQGIKDFKSQTKKIPLFLADQISRGIVIYLKKSPAVKQIDLLGSLRRKSAVVGDIDISVASEKPKKVINWFINYPKKTRVLEAGKTKARILVSKEYQVDLIVEPMSSYGSLLQHFTGSKDHNIHLRELALKKGYSLSEHGIKKLKSKIKKIKQFKTEKDFYSFLSLDWIPPELRENKGEIEASQKHQLPDLIKLGQIRGDLHVHSDFDIGTGHDLGADSMEKIVNKAKKLNYQYLAFAEHNPSISQHSEKQVLSVLKIKKELIDKLNYSSNKTTLKKLFIFNSLEIDIRPNGSRAIPDKALEILDFAIVSVHSSFRMDKDKMTQRILKALDHPKVKILGHPTGRMLGKRLGYSLNWDQIFDFCRRKNKFLEINAYPKRLDLTDSLIKEAVKNKVRMVINTDSHALGQMDFMNYGVSNARRGWTEAKDIINTLGYNQIKELLITKT